MTDYRPGVGGDWDGITFTDILFTGVTWKQKINWLNHPNDKLLDQKDRSFFLVVPARYVIPDPVDLLKEDRELINVRLSGQCDQSTMIARVGKIVRV